MRTRGFASLDRSVLITVMQADPDNRTWKPPRSGFEDLQHVPGVPSG